MKALITSIALILIIGIDCGARLIDELHSFEISIENCSESSSESESKESSEKKLKDYVGNEFNHPPYISYNNSDEKNLIEFSNTMPHDPWDEIPYPPPEYI